VTNVRLACTYAPITVLLVVFISLNNIACFFHVPQRICPPAPLWSHTPRWRERIQLGQMVEIRESASRADRPKWYEGIVRKIGGEKETTYDMSKGAELELTEEDDSTTNGNKRPLLVLYRTQQILVESPQENFKIAFPLCRRRTPRESTLLSLRTFAGSVCTEKKYVPWALIASGIFGFFSKISALAGQVAAALFLDEDCLSAMAQGRCSCRS
jgi:hypothetical protein